MGQQVREIDGTKQRTNKRKKVWHIERGDAAAVIKTTTTGKASRAPVARAGGQGGVALGMRATTDAVSEQLHTALPDAKW